MQENARRKYELCRDRLVFLKDTLSKFNDGKQRAKSKETAQQKDYLFFFYIHLTIF